MPLPAHIELGSGHFIIDSGFGVVLKGYQEPRLERARARFLTTLSRETGIPLAQEAPLNHPCFFIETRGPSRPVQQLGEDESYHLVITPTDVHLQAANPLGILHGLETFLQLVQIAPDGFRVPAVTIDDQPRFPFRGLMIDVGRHFIPVNVIERNLDGMEAVKLNVFHWHLSDDQGFRVESKLYPLLQKRGSDGLYYTQDQIRQVVAYAHDRGIRVIPEFDMPCHTTSWFVGYPDLASGPGPYHIRRKWGISDSAMDPTLESTYRFISRLIGEMAALFPDAVFHVGGDECNGKEWNANPRIQKFMRMHAIRDDAALQAYFTARVEKIMAAHGKVMEGWDEVLQPNTPKSVIIQSWRGQQSLVDAVRRGYRVVLSTGYYIDLNQPAAEHYAVDPLGPSEQTLSSQERKRVLGGEATMWTVFEDSENIDCHIWPRTAAIAERLWSPQGVRDVSSMYVRLALTSQWLEYYGLKHNASYPMMLRRMTGSQDPTALRVLGDVMQPVRFHTRERLGNYDAFTPLNRLVDALPPESETARRFLDLVDTIVSGPPSPQNVEEARKWLRLWRDNDARLQPQLPRSQLMQELIPVSTNLRQVAEVGLQTLTYLDSHRSAPAVWANRQIAFLTASEQPQADLLDMVAPAVIKLVQATSH